MRASRLLPVLCAGFLSGAAVPAAADYAGPVEVMNQNLYVGADIFRILEAQSPAQVPIIVAQILQIVAATDFESRAAVIADAVAERQPHLVGLQEVALYRRQSPGDFLLGNPQPAEDVWIDFLAILLDALAARGQSYVVAAEMADVDVEMPYFAGYVNGVPQLDDARLTDRNVILARADVPFSEVTEIHYVWKLSWSIGGVPIVFDRGYQSVDATIEGRSYRFANTHLEPGAATAGIRALQGAELVQRLSAADLPVILVGDLNAEPGDPAPLPGVDSPWQAFAAAGWEDAWLHRVGEPLGGLTCCHDELLVDPEADPAKRVDYILVRSDGELGGFPALGPVHLELLGDEPSEMTPSGLWPADHVGLQAHLLVAVPAP